MPVAANVNQARALERLGALAAAGVVSVLVGRRLMQQRRRKRGERIGFAEDPEDFELALRGSEDPVGRAFIDSALRTLTADLAAADGCLPVVNAVRLKPDQGVELHLGERASALAPFSPLDEAGMVWFCPVDGRLMGDDEAAEVSAPYPALVTLGFAPGGDPVLIDLEAAAGLTVRGRRDEVIPVLRAIAVELATSVWADYLTVTLVGFGRELPQYFSTERVAWVESLDQAVEEIRQWSASVDRVLADAGVTLHEARTYGELPDVWPTHVLITAEPVDPANKAVLQSVLDMEYPTSVAVAAWAGDHGETLASGWSVDAGAPFVVPGSGLMVDPQALSDDQYRQVLDVLSATSGVAAGPETEYWPDGGRRDYEFVNLEGLMELETETVQLPVMSGARRWTPPPAAAAAPPDSAASMPTVVALPGPGFGQMTAPEAPEAPEAPPRPEDFVGPYGADDHPTVLIEPVPVEPVPVEPIPVEPVPVPPVPSSAPASLPPSQSPYSPESQVPDNPYAVDPSLALATTSFMTAPVFASPEIRVLGPIESTGGHGGIKGADSGLSEIAAYLALHPGCAHDDVVRSVWPGREVPADALDKQLTQLRDWLGPDESGADRLLLGPDGRSYRLADSVRCDWQTFQERLAAGDVVAALGLVRGRPFQDAPVRRYVWAERLRQDMISAVVDVCDAAVQSCLDRDDPDAARAAATRGLLAAPESETLRRALLTALAAAGDLPAVREEADKLVAWADANGIELLAVTNDLIHELLGRSSRV